MLSAPGWVPKSLEELQQGTSPAPHALLCPASCRKPCNCSGHLKESRKAFPILCICDKNRHQGCDSLERAPWDSLHSSVKVKGKPKHKGKRKHRNPEHKHLNKSICCSPEASSPSEHTRGSALNTPCSSHSLQSLPVMMFLFLLQWQQGSVTFEKVWGLNLCDTAKVKSQEGQSGEYLCLIARQTDSASDGVCKAAIASCSDRFGSCLCWEW